MKMYFDFICNSKNYTVISIGRSLASIVEILGKKKRDVVCLPLSNLSDGLPAEIKHIDIYRDFLKSKGLTKEIIEANPERRYMLVDNTISGVSLQNAKSFLSREDLLGNPQRLEIVSAKDIFGEKYKKLSLDLIFANGILQQYSPVGRLDINNLENVFKQSNYKTCVEYSQKKALRRKELFDLAIDDKLDKYAKKRNR